MNTLASISNLFGGDMWILLVIVLILFGAKKLPELARGAGQAIREFTKAKDEFEREITRPPQDDVVVQEPKEKLVHNPAMTIKAPVAADAQPASPTHQHS